MWLSCSQEDETASSVNKKRDSQRKGRVVASPASASLSPSSCLEFGCDAWKYGSHLSTMEFQANTLKTGQKESWSLGLLWWYQAWTANLLCKKNIICLFKQLVARLSVIFSQPHSFMTHEISSMCFFPILNFSDGSFSVSTPSSSFSAYAWILRFLCLLCLFYYHFLNNFIHGHSFNSPLHTNKFQI